MTHWTARHDHGEAPWIDYRQSRANIACDRPDAPACPGCGCEMDVHPVPHSPRCKAAGE